MARRPSPWWSSWNITIVFLSRTKKEGAPWLGRSVTSGSARQIFRTRSSACFAPFTLLSSARRRRVVYFRHDSKALLGARGLCRRRAVRRRAHPHHRAGGRDRARGARLAVRQQLARRAVGRRVPGHV